MNGDAYLRKDEVFIDTILSRELESPGADTRFGVNLIARPSEDLVTGIIKMQRAGFPGPTATGGKKWPSRL